MKEMAEVAVAGMEAMPVVFQRTVIMEQEAEALDISILYLSLMEV